MATRRKARGGQSTKAPATVQVGAAGGDVTVIHHIHHHYVPPAASSQGGLLALRVYEPDQLPRAAARASQAKA